MSLTFPRMGTTRASTPLRWGVNCKASNIIDVDQISNLCHNFKATHKVFANKSKTNHQMMQNLQEFEPWLEELNLPLRDGGIFLPSSATDNWRIKLDKKLQNIKKQEERKSVGHTIIWKKTVQQRVNIVQKEVKCQVLCTFLGETSKFINKKKHFSMRYNV